MEFFRDLLPLVQKYMEQRERIDRVIENSKPIRDAYNKVKGVLLPDVRELLRVFVPDALEAPPRHLSLREQKVMHSALRRSAKKRKRK